jgi:hypothetical protein
MPYSFLEARGMPTASERGRYLVFAQESHVLHAFTDSARAGFALARKCLS